MQISEINMTQTEEKAHNVKHCHWHVHRLQYGLHPYTIGSLALSLTVKKITAYALAEAGPAWGTLPGRSKRDPCGMSGALQTREAKHLAGAT
jgi:hypothetical protein